MHKKGFTLIEIIGIIILLALIGLLVYPTIIRIIGDSKEDLYQKNISEIERMAANWASINEDKLPTIDKRGYYLKLDEMKEEGFIDGDVINPKTGEPLDGCVGIIYDKSKNRHNYKYYDDCNRFVKPILSNLVANTVENEYGWRNKDFYINLEGEYLDHYDYCIGDNKCNPNMRVENPDDGILINQEGIKYVCAKGSNTVGETTNECILYRLDKTKPVIGTITIDGTRGEIDWYISDVNVVTTKSKDNLSGILSDELSPSNRKITTDTKGTTYTLTAKDLAGNESSVSYTVKVDKTSPTVGELVINGTKGENDWYTSDVTLSVKNGSDATSGHRVTTSNISKITSNTSGKKVIVTTKDNAGNISTKPYTIKVDKNAPTITPKYSTVTIGSISEVNVSDLFIINYSTSGGYVTCNVNKTKDIKAVNNPLRCTVKGGNGLIAEARINVKNQLASIAVTTPPNKTLYSVGSAFDKTGMVVTAYYKDGTSKVVTNYTVESSVTRYGSSHIGKVKKNWGINYLYPTRRDNDEYDNLIITYTEDGVTKTTTTPITVAIYANQVKNIVIAPELPRVRVEKITDYNSASGSHIKTSYQIPTDNEYYRYEVGSNYIRLHSLKAGYYSSDSIRVHYELYDGTIFRAGYFENIDSVNTDIKYSFTVARFIKNSPPYGQFIGASGYLFQQRIPNIVLGWQTFNNITDASGSAPIGASAQNGATYMEYKFSNFVMNGRNMNVVYTLDS